MSYQHTLDVLVEYARAQDNPEIPGPEIEPGMIAEMHEDVAGRLCLVSGAMISRVIALPNGKLQQIGEVIENLGSYGGFFNSFARPNDIISCSLVGESSGIYFKNRNFQSKDEGFFVPLAHVDLIADVDEKISSDARLEEYFSELTTELHEERPDLTRIAQMANSHPFVDDDVLLAAIYCKIAGIVIPANICSSVFAMTYVTRPIQQSESNDSMEIFSGLLTTHTTPDTQSNFTNRVSGQTNIGSGPEFSFKTLDPSTGIRTIAIVKPDNYLGYTAPK